MDDPSPGVIHEIDVFHCVGRLRTQRLRGGSLCSKEADVSLRGSKLRTSGPLGFNSPNIAQRHALPPKGSAAPLGAKPASTQLLCSKAAGVPSQLFPLQALKLRGQTRN